MNGIRVVTDSSCDLPQALVDQHQIGIVPLSIRFGDETLVDRFELTTDDFWRRCAASPQLPETAAPSTGAFEEAFRAAAADGAEGVVCVCISGDLSATIQSARLAAEAVAGDIPVRVIDSRSVSMGTGLQVLEAAEAAELGKSLDDVAGLVEELVERTHVVAALDTLDNLKKGGRIGAAQAMIGSLLSFKPIISVAGEVEPLSRQRTRPRSLRFLIDALKEGGRPDRLAVVHGQAPDLEQFLSQLDSVFPRDEIAVAELGPVVGSHGGPGVMGLAWLDAS